MDIRSQRGLTNILSLGLIAALAVFMLGATILNNINTEKLQQALAEAEEDFIRPTTNTITNDTPTLGVPAPGFENVNETVVVNANTSVTNTENNNITIEPPVVVDPTADWVTFTSNELDFSFRHPAIWDIIQNDFSNDDPVFSPNHLELKIGIPNEGSIYPITGLELVGNDPGTGPYFPTTLIRLDRSSSGKYVITSEENQSSEYTAKNSIRTIENDVSVPNNIWVNYITDSNDLVEWMKTVKMIIGSFQFTN